jgi:hypothetical protein
MIYNFLTRKTSAIHDMFEDIVFSYLESKGIQSDHNFYGTQLRRGLTEYYLNSWKDEIHSQVKVLFKYGSEFLQDTKEYIGTLDIVLEENEIFDLDEAVLEELYMIRNNVYTDNVDDLK